MDKAKLYAKKRSHDLFVAGGKIAFPEIEKELELAYRAGIEFGKVEAHRREHIVEQPTEFPRGLT